MERCPICKDHRTQREIEQRKYRTFNTYRMEIKIGNKREQYNICDKCKTAWIVPSMEMRL